MITSSFEALRIVAGAGGDKIFFKGGSSLSKGWNLNQRFSEDIDIFLDPLACKPAQAVRRVCVASIEAEAGRSRRYLD